MPEGPERDAAIARIKAEIAEEKAQVIAAGGLASVQDIVKIKARKGVPIAGAVLGRALYNAVVLLDIERIALGGSVFWHHRDYLLPRLQAHTTGHLPALTDGVLLVPAGLGDTVGDYAALALAA